MLAQKLMHIAGAAIVLSMAATAGPTSAEAKEYRYGSPLPRPVPINKVAIIPVLDRIAKETQGRVTFKFFGGGQLVGPRNALSGLKSGIVDAAFVILPFIPSEVPYNSLVSESIGYTKNALAAAGALNEFLLVKCPECRQEMAKHGALWIGAGATDEYTIQCRFVINGLSDLKGKKIRVAGGATGRWVEKLGMVPTFMPPPEIAPAMQRGRIDCALAPTSWLLAFSIKDGAKSVIDRPMGIGMGGGTVLRLAAWKSMKPEDRARIIAAMPGLIYDETVKGFGKPGAAGRAVSKKKGIKFMTTLPDLEKNWAEFREAERAALIANAKKRGIKNPEEVIDRMVATFDKWLKLAPSFDGDPAAFKAAVKKHVYDKAKLN